MNKDKFDSSVGNKFSLYSELKSEIRFGTYLDLLKNFKTVVTKMWISCHLLPIESGRYKKIPTAERICPLCKRSAIGDEFHFWLKCNHSSLSHVRGTCTFLGSLYSINSNLIKHVLQGTIFIYHVYV